MASKRDGAANREYELRLTIDPDAAEHLVSHPLIRPSLSHRQVGHLVSTYFDTPDSWLQRHRFGLRVRRAGNAVTHTLKHVGTSLVDRGEWERVDESQTPNVVWLRDTPLASLLGDDAVVDTLAPRFTVDVTRTTFPLKHKRATIEAALDQGTIRAEGLSLPLDELELEIKRGKHAAVLDLARSLVRELPLTLSLATKSERGYAVGDLTWGRPSKAITPKLKKDMNLAQVFEAIVQTCLHTFLKNIALIRGESDGEAVHEGRIALRHLRAACQLFGPVLRRKRFATLCKEIKWLSDRLGAARDADVFQESTFEPAARHDGVPDAKSLALFMAERRGREHRRLRKALASSRARLLYLDLLAFSADGVRRKRRGERFRPFVRAALARRRRKLARRAKDIGHQAPAALHEVRKAAKMLRYDLDLFESAPKLVPGKKERLGKALKALQISLGEIHDQEAVREHLQGTILAKHGRLAVARGKHRRVAIAAAHIVATPIERAAPLREATRAARHL